MKRLAYAMVIGGISILMLSCSTWGHKEYKVGETVNGFVLKNVVNVPEIHGKAYFFEHKKTHAPLLYLSNDDNNQTFGIAFKTPPKDSTGVFHVFEHSVLAGSRKYPSKSLFFQVAGASVNTFQNAMTYSDKTFFPVASTNEKDFENLVDIYMDSVFYPRVLTDRRIFEREGWRYELTKGKLAYNGVVFSEMKGAFSNPDRFVWQKISESEFSKNSPYHYESGGDVLHIPDLTYKHLQATHKKYYHPSNSYIIFYGNGPIAKHLKIVNDDYLSHFTARKETIKIPVETPKKKMVVLRGTYPVTSAKNTDGKVIHARSFVFAPQVSSRDHFGMMVLDSMLMDFENSPLKRKLTDDGTCRSVESDLESTKQPIYSLICRGSTSGKMHRFSRDVDAVFKQIEKKGFPKDLMEAAINKVDFQLREYSTINRGLVEAGRVLDSWLYGGPALAYVRYMPDLDWMRVHADSSWFQNLMKRYLIDNGHQSLVSVRPDAHMLARIHKEMENKLAKDQKKLGMAAIKQQIADFDAWNKAPVPQEIQDKVPRLKVSDLDKTAKTIDRSTGKEEGATVIGYPMSTQGINYVDFYFNLNGIPKSWVRYLPLLSESLGKVHTAHHTFKDLDLAVYKVSGGVSTHVEVYPHKGDANLYDARFVVSTKALKPDLAKALELLKEIILESRFDSPQRIAQIFRDYQSQIEAGVGSRAIYYSLTNTRAKLNRTGQFKDLLSGAPQLFFLRDLAKKKDFKSVDKRLQEMTKAIFQRSNLVVAYGAESSDGAFVKSAIDPILKSLPAETAKDKDLNFKSELVFDGAAFSGQVQFVTIFGQSPKVSSDYGLLKAVSQYLSVQYLNPKLREQGGAYGGDMIVNEAGELGFYSYRDPRLDGTYDDIMGVPRFLKATPDNSKKINAAILRTVGDMDRPLTASGRLTEGMRRYFEGITPDDIQTYRDQAFSLDEQKLRQASTQIDEVLHHSVLSVVGYKPKLQASRLLKKIIDL